MDVSSCCTWDRTRRILTQREGAKYGLESWINLLDEAGEHFGEDHRLTVEGSKQVAQVLASLNVALLDGGDLGAGGSDGGSDAADVGNDGLDGSVLLVFASVGENSMGGLFHVGAESVDFSVEAHEEVSEHRASSALLDSGDPRNGSSEGESSQSWEGEKGEPHFDGGEVVVRWKGSRMMKRYKNIELMTV